MIIQHFASVSDLPKPLVERFSYPAEPNFFLSLDWFRCLYDTCLCGTWTPRLYALTAGDDILGVLYCMTDSTARTLRSMTNFYTNQFGPSVFGDTITREDVLVRLLEHIALEKPRWHSIELRYLDSALLGDTGLTERSITSTHLRHSYHQYENWYQQLGGDGFDAYYAARSSRVRNTIARKEKKLRRAHAIDFRIYTDPGPGLEDAIRAYVNIYNRSWKRPEPFQNLIPELVRQTSALGILRLGILHVDSEPVAAQLWITANKKAVIYKLAYLEEFAALSPGSILSREMFRYAIDVDVVLEIDYGIGNESYKRDWMDSVRFVLGLRALSLRTMKGIGLSASEIAREVARKTIGHYHPRGAYRAHPLRQGTSR